MDYKYHLEKILDEKQTVQEYTEAIKQARKALFLDKNKALIHYISLNKHFYMDKGNKVLAIKEISNDYEIKLTDAMNIVDHLEWYK